MIPNITIALLALSALASNVLGSVEKEQPVKVRHKNSGPKYEIDDLERTRLGTTQDTSESFVSPPRNPFLMSGEAVAGPQQQAGDDVASILTAASDNDQQQQQPNGASGNGVGTARGTSKRARQLMNNVPNNNNNNNNNVNNVEDNNQLASDSTERHIKFTLDLMQSIFSSQSYSAKTNLIESFLISPLSIQMVLMMMHLGARGQTRREISNCLHLTQIPQTSTTTLSSSSSSSSPTSQNAAASSHGSSTNPDKSSLIMMHHQHQQQQQQQHQLNAATVGNDLGAAVADSMGSKLKRRHHQASSSSSSENAKQQQQNTSSNSKSQPTSNNLRHQQTSASSSSSSSSSAQQQITSSAASNAAAAATQTAAASTSAAAANNPHELFGGAMRNLLKDPIVMKALTSANQIFLQKNLPLSAQYEWAIKHYYAADVKLVDFQHQSQQQQQSAQTPMVEKSKQQQQHYANNNGDHSPLALAQNSTITNVTLMEHHHQHQQQSKQISSRDGDGNNNIQQMVNDWIERQTKGKISNFLSSPISTSTLMMAINVLYFKGDWQYKFDPQDTQTDAWFTQANGKTTQIPMMVNRLPLAFAHDPAMKTAVIELPYKAQRLGLFLLLPDEVSGIFHTMQMLNSSSFANLISSMRKPMPGADLSTSGINVRIPKFSIESSPRLSHILSHQLGLKTLFMPDVADLSGMFGPYQSSQHKQSSGNSSSNSQQTHRMTDNIDNNSQQMPLQVGLDELLHKAVLQVDEQGSVASAASATILERVGLFNSNYFEADHPFLLFLMDKQTGLVLFSGVFAGNSNNINTPNNNHESQQQWH